MLLVKIAEYIGFCVYRRSYSIWSPVTVGLHYRWRDKTLEIRVRVGVLDSTLVKRSKPFLSKALSRFGDKSLGI